MKRSVSALITAFTMLMSVNLSVLAENKESVSMENTAVRSVSVDVELTSGETVQVVPGDVNSDGVKDIEDVVWTLLYINGEKTLTKPMVVAADADQDGEVDIIDVVQMLEEIYGQRTEVVRDKSESEPDSSMPDESQEPEQMPSDPEPEYIDDLSELKKTLTKQVAGYNGKWSVYVKNLDTGASFEINNRPVYAASLIKLYAMGDAYEQIENGKLNKSQLAYYLKIMITVSDNNAFNYIAGKLGAGDINRWCKAHGFNDTVQYHTLRSAMPAAYGENRTSVVDTGNFLEQVYRGELVSKQASKEMYDLLLAQQRRWKIPAGLPSGTKCANKTGETTDYCHDAAIISSDGADYILTVMVEYRNYAYSCNGNIANVSRTVYNYFNKK